MWRKDYPKESGWALVLWTNDYFKIPQVMYYNSFYQVWTDDDCEHPANQCVWLPIPDHELLASEVIKS